MTFYPTKLNNTPQDNKYLVEFIHGYFLWGRESRDNGQQTTDNCTRADLLHRDATIVPSGDELRVLATPMADGKQHTDYDQLILETKNGSTTGYMCRAGRTGGRTAIRRFELNVEKTKG